MRTAASAPINRARLAAVVRYASHRRRVADLRRALRESLAGPVAGVREAARRLAEAEESAAEVGRMARRAG